MPAKTHTIHLLPRAIEAGEWCDIHFLPHILVIEMYALDDKGVRTYTFRRCDER